MMLWLTSGHDVPLETARSDHRSTVASMASRRAGRIWAELAWPPLRDRDATSPTGLHATSTLVQAGP